MNQNNSSRGFGCPGEDTKRGEGMIRGTTPTFTLIINGYDLTEMTVHVTLTQGDTAITLTGNRLATAFDDESSTIVFRLTQEETLSLKKGTALIQVRFVDAAGEAYATEDQRLSVDPVLEEGVIEYAGD